MKITRSNQNDVAVLHLEGQLDSVTSIELQSVVLSVVRTAPHRFAIDFRHVSYVSSAGLRVVLMAAKQARAAGGEVAIFGLNNPVLETFEISGFARIIAIAPTEAEAISAIRGNT